MNLLQIEAERGRDDLPTVTIHVGDHTNINVEVLRPRRSRWHWWLDKGRHTTEHTIMCPVVSVKLTHWGADRGAKTLPSTFVVPKEAANRIRRVRQMFKGLPTSEDVLGPVDPDALLQEPWSPEWRRSVADEIRETMYFPDEYKTPGSP